MAWNRTLHVDVTGRLDLHYRAAGTWVRDHVPENAVVSCMVTSGALYYYTSVATLRYDGVSADVADRYVQRIRQLNRPIYALLFPFELEPAKAVHGTDGWEKVRNLGTSPCGSSTQLSKSRIQTYDDQRHARHGNEINS